MRSRRDLLVLAGLLALLIAFVAFGPGRANDFPGGRGSSHSSVPDGALALYRWLAELDYSVSRLEYRAFALNGEIDLLFLLAPSSSYSAAEVDALLAWIEAGGTLVLADDRPAGQSTLILRKLGLQAVSADIDWSRRAAILQPALDSPAVDIPTDTSLILRSERADVAALVGTADAPILLGMQYGRGYIYASTALTPFTNSGLHDQSSAALLLGLLRRVAPGSTVVFDEIHHGFVREPSLRTLLLGHPLGWATLYTLLLIAGYLVTTGRRFGRPVPLREETARRSSAEYVESMAGLLRRGGKRSFIADHYRSALKRRLARPYGLNPGVDDAAFVAEIAAVAPLDAADLVRMLARLRDPHLSEAELLRLIAQADTLG